MEKPKVRFSRSPVSSDQKETTNTNSKGKVKIKSIVPINYPIKIIKNSNRILTNNQDNVNKLSENNMRKCLEINKTYSNTDNGVLKDSKSVQPSYCILDTLSTASSSRISIDENSSENDYHDNGGNDNLMLQNCIDKLNRIVIGDSLVSNSDTLKDSKTEISHSNRYTLNDSNMQSIQTNIPCITCEDSDQDSDIEVIQVIKSTVNSRIKHQSKKNLNHDNPVLVNSKMNCKNAVKQNKYKTKQKENKENCSKTTSRNNLENELLLSKSGKILKDSNNTTNKVSTAIIKKKSSEINKKIVLVSPKFRKSSLSKNKSEVLSSKTTVTKSAVLDVIGSQSNISVEPTIVCNKYHDNIDSDLNEVNEKRNVISKDLLSKPEYNSTINLIKNLKEIEREELVTNLENLPLAYKNLIYGKVSTALDFAPYESVYTDLINLSVDDDKLPTRLIRSKDPEPRNKDIVPKLFDFYNPKYTEQYFTIVNPPTLNPLTMNTLSSFTISNKIYSWKTSRDKFE